jgi:hypothetical protein
MLYHKCCIISLLLILIFLYFYVKKENFDTQETMTTNSTPIPIPTTIQQPIGVQLRNEIGRVLDISPSRINNLKFEGDINLNTLRIDFDILDNNLIENLKNEITQNEAETKAINLMKTDTFIVRINNKSIILRVLLPQSNPTVEEDKTRFFNNKGLKEISTYANNKYISVPNDESLTKFYTLGFDKNYNLIPKI